MENSQIAVRQRQDDPDHGEVLSAVFGGDNAVQSLNPGHYSGVFGKDEQLVFFINWLLEFVIRHISGIPYFN